MNILEELRALDPREPGRWPLPVLAGAVGVAFLVLSALGIYFFVWSEQRPRLEQFAAEEQKLRSSVIKGIATPASGSGCHTGEPVLLLTWFVYTGTSIHFKIRSYARSRASNIACTTICMRNTFAHGGDITAKTIADRAKNTEG